MMKVFPIRKEKREEIPAVTHADGTGRLVRQSLKIPIPRYHANDLKLLRNELVYPSF